MSFTVVDSGCESGTEPEHPQDQSHPEAIQGNLLSIQPERIRCGVCAFYLLSLCKDVKKIFKSCVLGLLYMCF